MEDLIKQALDNEYTEAQVIVNQKMEEDDKTCFYKMYTIGKILMNFLEQRIQEGDEFAQKINDHLKVMVDYYDNKDEKCSNKM